MSLPVNLSKTLYYLVAALSMLFAKAETGGSAELAFDIRIVSVSFKSAEFELIDDYSTPTNYLIQYDTTSFYDSVGPTGTTIHESDHTKGTFEIQTNSKVNATRSNLTNQTTAVDFTFWDNGVQLKPEEMDLIQSRSSQQQHRFTVDTLDENRVFDVNFNVIASLAQRKVFQSEAFFDSRRTIRKLRLRFKTKFDIQAAAQDTCQRQMKYEMKNVDSELKTSCYVAGSNCTRCSPGCYQLKDSATQKNVTVSKQSEEAVLCQRCPCDTSKSSGECTVTEDRSEVFNPQMKFTCSQCVGPYAGDLCGKCRGEGFDLFRNERGECRTCQCSGNSPYDNTDFNSHSVKTKRKCAPVTGRFNKNNYNNNDLSFARLVRPRYRCNPA